jgi:hypothetical protein
MFAPIEIPFGCVMLFNVIDLKDGVTVEDVELVLGEMCNVVKNTCGDDHGGFIAGKVLQVLGLHLRGRLDRRAARRGRGRGQEQAGRAGIGGQRPRAGMS